MRRDCGSWRAVELQHLPVKTKIASCNDGQVQVCTQILEASSPRAFKSPSVQFWLCKWPLFSYTALKSVDLAGKTITGVKSGLVPFCHRKGKKKKQAKGRTARAAVWSPDCYFYNQLALPMRLVLLRGTGREMGFKALISMTLPCADV